MTDSIIRGEQGPRPAPASPPYLFHDSLPGLLLASEETGGRCALLISVERSGAEPPRHIHRREDELCYILEGQLTYHVGETTLEVGAGACVWLPRDVAHTFVVRSPEAKVLTFYLPGGFEGCVHALAPPIEPALAIERLIAIAATYGCEIVGPALSGAAPHLRSPEGSEHPAPPHL